MLSSSVIALPKSYEPRHELEIETIETHRFHNLQRGAERPAEAGRSRTGARDNRRDSLPSYRQAFCLKRKGPAACETCIGLIAPAPDERFRSKSRQLRLRNRRCGDRNSCWGRGGTPYVSG